MSEKKTLIYKNAPIVEAVIDIHVRYAKGADLSSVERFRDELRAEFPTSSPINFFQLGLNANPEGENSENPLTVKSNSKKVGWRLDSLKKDRVIQVRDKGFGYSHLAPYTNWANFSLEAKLLWRKYVETCKPEVVTRIALRYVNKIVIPSVSLEFKDYFKIYPEISSEIPVPLNAFFLQVQLAQTDLKPDTNAIINFAHSDTPDPNAVAVMLDFDVFQNASYEPKSDVIWDYLNVLRDRKNLLFESAITDKTRELFK